MTDIESWSDEKLRARHGEVKTITRALLDECRAIVGSAKSPKTLSDTEGKRAGQLIVRAEASTQESRSIHAERERRKNLSPTNPYAERDAMTMEALAQQFPKGLFGPARSTIGGKSRDSSWSSTALKAMSAGDPYGSHRKALAVAGSVSVPTTLNTTVVREGDRPALVRALLPVEVITGTDRFAWLQQTIRETNATAVARGALKPTSRYSVTRREDRVRVVAHLSEAVDRIDLEDSAGLAEFVDTEMRQGVIYASEAQLIGGDGQGENMTGILNTPGITAQPFSTDVFTTLRRALTTQQVLHNTPSAWVMSPQDWQDIELTREDGATGGFILSQGPVDRAAQKLWGLPVVVTDVVPVGSALLGDFAGSARLYLREQTVVSWSEAMWRPDAQGGGSTDFARNQLVVRAEERLGLALLRPSAFTEVDLTA